MDTNNLELLVEKLILTNEAMLDELSHIKDDICDIKEELNWVGEHSYAKVVYEGLNEISSKLDSVESGISNVDINTSNL